MRLSHHVQLEYQSLDTQNTVSHTSGPCTRVAAAPWTRNVQAIAVVNIGACREIRNSPPL